jgi:GT2 family glycosyltransferase
MRDDDMRRRAVSLAERLVSVDTRMIGLEEEAAVLRAQLGGRPTRQSTSVAGYEPPLARYPWPLADDPKAEASRLTFYDRRVDDPALIAARQGQAFLHRHKLTGGSPDFAAAAASLREAPRALPAADPGHAPDVSIVVPIHGQLAWTLNCLDSLFAHTARSSAEIIIVDDASPDESAALLPDLEGAAAPLLRYLRLAQNQGFVAACNTGAAAARGALLVFLNNDTRVVTGWLDALAESFGLLPQAGLVGSKLLYPDGSLQEAGGIIWRDGSAWNYGRGDDPNRPHFCHARQADYISGASIAIPKPVWQELGGFDTRYAPAYGEDADLALRVRAAGRTVWYQPQSRVIHYEGKTSGTDLGAGVKAHQVVNQKKLLLRWHRELAAHRPNGQFPYFERERGVVRRALIVDATNPTPRMDAGSVTTTITLRLFQELGYKAYFVPQDNFLFEPEHTEALLRMGVECAYAPYDVGFPDYIARTGRLFDVVLVYRVGILDRVLEDLRRHAPQSAVLFHAMDLHFLRMQRAAAISGHVGEMQEAAAMKARELDLIRKVDCAITHSTYERELLASEAPGAPVVVWPFMFDLFGTSVAFEQRSDYCFLGGYRHPPNVDAVLFFAEQIFPLIRARQKQARFVVAGANPGPELLALAGPDIEVTGMVDDLRSVFDRVRVFVCPLRIGAGTKGKVSTAMSYGLPVVSTSCGAEGMDLVDGQDVLIADEPEAFAEACLRVHEDAALWRQLSEAGQALVLEKHSPEMGRRVLNTAIELALARRLGL